MNYFIGSMVWFAFIALIGGDFFSLIFICAVIKILLQVKTEVQRVERQANPFMRSR